MDKFKQYLNQHADELGNDEPGAIVWKNLQRGLPAVHEIKPASYWYKYAAAACIIAITAFAFGRFTVQPISIVKYQTVYVKQPATIQQPIVNQVPVVTTVARHALHKQKRVTASEPSSELTQQLRSVYASERIGAIMKITAKNNLNGADLKMLALALSEDPNTNVRLAIINALRPMAARQDIQAVFIKALSGQNDELIKSSLVDLLIDTKSKQAIPQMIAMLGDKNTNADIQNKIKAGIESFLN